MTTLLVKSDNLKYLRAATQSDLTDIALAYLDPPFYTQRDHYMGEELAFGDTWPSLPFEPLASRVTSRRKSTNSHHRMEYIYTHRKLTE